MSARLAPTVTQDTEFFWSGLKEHKLLVQRCGGCGALRHPPRPMCPRCQSLEWEAIESAGRGRVFSFVRPHHPPLPWFEPGHVVALVELDEGTRIVTNIVGIEPEAVRMGMRVRVRYEEFEGGDGSFVLALFVPEDAP